MPRLTGQQLQDYRTWKQQGQEKGRGGILGQVESMGKSLVSPFAHLPSRAVNLADIVTSPEAFQQAAQGEYDPVLGSKEGFQQFMANPVSSGVKDAATIGSYAVPGGQAFGGGARGAIASGAIQGTMGGFGASGPGEELEGTIKGGLAGAGTAGLLHVGTQKLAGKPITWKGDPSISGGKILSSSNDLNKEFEQITKKTRGYKGLSNKEQLKTIQKFVDELPSDQQNQVADEVRSVAKSIYGIEPSAATVGKVTGEIPKKGLGQKLKKWSKTQEEGLLTRRFGGKSGGGRPNTREGGMTLFGEMQDEKILQNLTDGPDEVLQRSLQLQEELGPVVGQQAEQLAQQGAKADVSPIRQYLKEQVKLATTAEAKAPYQTALSRIEDITSEAGSSRVPVDRFYRFKQDIGSEAYESGAQKLIGKKKALDQVYKKSNDLLDQSLKDGGFNEFRKVNRTLNVSQRAKDYATRRMASTAPARPIGALDVMSAGGGMAAGGPVGAGVAYGAQKVARHPRTEMAAIKGARGLGNILEGKNMPNINMSPGMKQGLMRGGQTAQRVAPSIGGQMYGGSTASPPGMPMEESQMLDSRPGAGLGMGGGPPIGPGGGQMSGFQGGQQIGQLPPDFEKRLGMAVVMGLLDPSQAEFIGKMQGVPQFQEDQGSTKLTEMDKKFSVAQQQAIGALDLLESGQAATGKIEKLTGGVERFFGKADPGQTDYRSKISLARTSIRNAMLGANMSPGEMESISGFIPEFSDEPAEARQKLMSFIQAIEQFKGAAGINETGMMQPQQGANYDQQSTLGMYQ